MGGTSGPASAALVGRAPAVRRLVYCIGAQKASTTWLAQALSRHPDCHVPRVKELHHWNGRTRVGPARERALRAHARRCLLDLATAPLRRRSPSRDLARYELARIRLSTCRDPSTDGYVRRLLRGYRGQAVAADLTPDYALLPSETFAEMAALHPDARFVFIMRDPVDRFWSNCRHLVRAWPTQFGTGPSAARDAFATLVGHPRSATFRRSRYDATMAALEASVPAQRILYLFYETVRTPSEVERISEAVGLRDLDWRSTGRVNAAQARDLRPKAEPFAAARRALAPVYDDVARRFGATAPSGWQWSGDASGAPVAAREGVA